MQMQRPRGIFVGGTGTGVGKTVFSILLMTHLQGRGLKVAPMKPAETGCKPAPGDALALIAAASGIYPVETVCPYRLAMPAAPEAAAQAEKIRIRIQVILKAFRELAGKSDFVVVEGAGAVATPYARGLTGIELARKLELPVMLVTNEKLGTVGQTIAAVRALRYSRTECLGVVLSTTAPGPAGPHTRGNEGLLRSHLKNVPFLGSLPHLELPGDSLGKIPYTLVESWAKKNLPVFQESIGPAVDTVLTL
jgi:dethiobiotin synthetase